MFSRQAAHHDLHPMLREWAGRFTGDIVLRDQIVEATICTLIDDPDQIESIDARSSLLDVLRRVAMRILDWRKGPLDIRGYPEHNGYVLELSNGVKSDRMRFTSEKSAISYAKTLNVRILSIGAKVIPLRNAGRSHRRSTSRTSA